MDAHRSRPHHGNRRDVQPQLGLDDHAARRNLARCAAHMPLLRQAYRQAEQSLFGTTHSEAGYRLTQKWALPDSLAEVIRHHHRPELGQRHPALDHIVFLANLIMSRFHAGLELEKQDNGALAPRLRAIGLSTGELPRIVDMIPLSVFEAAPAAAITA